MDRTSVVSCSVEEKRLPFNFSASVSGAAELSPLGADVEVEVRGGGRREWFDTPVSPRATYTSFEPGRACGIATVQVAGVDSRELADYLWKHHRIFTVGIKHPEFEGVRISPSVYSTLEEVDRFAEILEQVAKKGIG